MPWRRRTAAALDELTTEDVEVCSFFAFRVWNGLVIPCEPTRRFFIVTPRTHTDVPPNCQANGHRIFVCRCGAFPTAVGIRSRRLLCVLSTSATRPGCRKKYIFARSEAASHLLTSRQLAAAQSAPDAAWHLHRKRRNLTFSPDDLNQNVNASARIDRHCRRRRRHQHINEEWALTSWVFCKKCCRSRLSRSFSDTSWALALFLSCLNVKT